MQKFFLRVLGESFAFHPKGSDSHRLKLWKTFKRSLTIFVWSWHTSCARIFRTAANEGPVRLAASETQKGSINSPSRSRYKLKASLLASLRLRSCFRLLDVLRMWATGPNTGKVSVFSLLFFVFCLEDGRRIFSYFLINIFCLWLTFFPWCLLFL